MASKTSAFCELQARMAPVRDTFRLSRADSGRELTITTIAATDATAGSIVEQALASDAADQTGPLTYYLRAIGKDAAELGLLTIKSRGGASAREMSGEGVNTALVNLVSHMSAQVPEHYSELFRQQQLSLAQKDAQIQRLIDIISNQAEEGSQGDEKAVAIKMAADGIGRFMNQGLPALIAAYGASKRLPASTPSAAGVELSHLKAPSITTSTTACQPLRDFCASLSDHEIKNLIRVAMNEGFLEKVIPVLGERAGEAVEVAQAIQGWVEED